MSDDFSSSSDTKPFHSTDERSPNFTGPRLWNYEHWLIVMRGKAAIDQWKNPRNREFHLRRAPLSGVDLEGAELSHSDLRDAHLEKSRLSDANLRYADLSDAHLEQAVLKRVNLQDASLRAAHLEKAEFLQAHLERADLVLAKMEHSQLAEANLENAHLEYADLKNAYFHKSYLRSADLHNANLKNANLWHANLTNADLTIANLENARLEYSIMDGGTLLSACEVDDGTNCTGVGLANVRIEPELRSRLEKNVRRIGWERRYVESLAARYIVRPFMWLSDYGSSSLRLVSTFLYCALAFAYLYWLPMPAWPNGEFTLQEPVTNVNSVDGVLVPDALRLPRCIYFSVVTMTTLGFGDITANPFSPCGYVLIGLQVLIGYILLGAFITRFAILFQSVD